MWGSATTALGAQGVTYALGIVTSVVIARSLGAVGRGEYLLPVTAAATCVAVFQLGVELANTFLAAERGYSHRRLSATCSFLGLLVAPLAIGAMALFYAAGGERLLAGVGWPELLIAAFVVPVNVHNIWLTNLFVLAKRLPQAQLALVAGAVVQFAGVGLLAIVGALSVRAVLLLWAASITVPWLIQLWLARGFASAAPAYDPAALRDVLAHGSRLYPVSLFSFLLFRIDVFLVAAYAGARAVGIYTLAVLFAEMIWLLGHPLVTAVLAFQVGEERAAASTLSFKAGRFNLALSIPPATLFAVAGWFAIPAIYGEEFASAYGALMALLPGILLMAAARPVSQWLLRAGRPVKLSAMYVAAAVGNAALNVVLIPELGISGASLASSIAYGALAVGLIAWAMRLTGSAARDVWTVQADDVATVRRILRR